MSQNRKERMRDSLSAIAYPLVHLFPSRGFRDYLIRLVCYFARVKKGGLGEVRICEVVNNEASL